MARDEHHPDKKLDAAKEGDRGSATTQKVASEAVADEPQAQPTKKFTTYSGTSDKTLPAQQDGADSHAAAASQFVLEDKAKGVEHTAGGQRRTHADVAGDGGGAPDKKLDQPAPRHSFLQGLKKIFDTASSPEEAEQMQSKFSIEYILSKAKDLVGGAFTTGTNLTDNDAPAIKSGQQTGVPQEAQGQLIASNDGYQENALEFLQNRVRGERSEKALEAPVQKPHLSEEALHVAAKTLHDAANANCFGVPVADAKTILNTLDPIKPADRDRIMTIYRQDYKAEFQADIAGRLLPQDNLQLQTLLHRDGTSHADDLGSVERSLDTLQFSKVLADTSGALGLAQLMPLPDVQNIASAGEFIAGSNAIANKTFAERQLRETLGTLQPKDLGALFNEYANAHLGEPSLSATLLNNPNLSVATREALAIYLKKGANLDAGDVRKLAEIGLKYGNPDVFNEAFVNNSNPALNKVREEYMTPARQIQMKQKFGDYGAEIALDYVRSAGIGTATLIHGDTRFYGSNKEHIAFALEHISDTERKDFADGMRRELTKEPGDTTLPPFSAYSQIHDALKAAGSPREVAMWEAQITRGGGLIAQLAALHDDGIPVFNTGLRINEHHDANKMLQVVNNIGEQDWNAIHADPLYRRQIDRALNTFLNDGSIDDQSLRYFIDAKLSAKTFEEAKLVTPESLGIKVEKAEASEAAPPKMDLPPDTRPGDVLKAFIDGTHNVTIADVRQVLHEPDLSLGETKSEFAHKFQQDLDAKLLSKVDPLDRLEILRLLSPEPRNARADFYGARFDAKDHSSAIGDPLMTALSNSSAVQREEHLNKIYGYVQANGSDVDRLSAEKQEELGKLFVATSDMSHHYSMQNHQFTEQFADASIGVAAGVAAPFTAGGSWELYVTLMAVGGTYKAAMRPILEGGNYQANPMTAGKDIFTGGISTLVAVLGPEMLGINKLAASGTASVLLKENAELFAQGVTKQQLERELAKVSENILARGAKDGPTFAEQAFAKLAKKYAAPGCEDQVAQLMNKTLAEKTLPLARNALTKIMYERGLVVAAGGAGGGINEVSAHIFDKNHGDLGKQAIQGILIGAVSAGILDTVFHGTVKLVKATHGRFAGKDVVEVKAGILRLQTVDGETFHEPNSNLDVTGDLQVTADGRAAIVGPEKTVVGSADGQGVIIDHATGKEHHFDGRVAKLDALDYQAGLENEADLFIVNLKQDQQLMFQGKEWRVVEFSHKGAVLGELKVESFDRKGLMSKLGRSEKYVGELTEGANIWDSRDRQLQVVRKEGRAPNETYVVSSVSEQRSVSMDELKSEYPDVVSASPMQLLYSHGDPEIAALGRGEITLGERMETDPDKKLLWYHAVCRDPVTDSSYKVLFRTNLSPDDVKRMQKEVLTQTLFKHLGFDNGYPPSAIRRLNIDGHDVVGFVQKWEGEAVQTSLPKLIESRLYGQRLSSPEGAFTPCREELQLVLKPDSDPQLLFKSLSERAAQDASLTPAVQRFQTLMKDADRLKAIRSDRDFAQFRTSMEQAILERNVLGDFDDHADNFMMINDASGHLKTVRNLDVAHALDEEVVPHFVLRKNSRWITNDIYAILDDSPISQPSLEKLSEFVQNPETKARLSAGGFNESQINQILTRAKHFIEHRKFGKVTNVRV